mmetsp:Transcript_12715/g.20226  ORF Transcript_12715/g.20226 Transcript_12715/m.20226 type:complete len:211 (-) Transcript_12715:244-876(-)
MFESGLLCVNQANHHIFDIMHSFKSITKRHIAWNRIEPEDSSPRRTIGILLVKIRIGSILHSLIQRIHRYILAMPMIAQQRIHPFVVSRRTQEAEDQIGDDLHSNVSAIDTPDIAANEKVAFRASPILEHSRPDTRGWQQFELHAICAQPLFGMKEPSFAFMTSPHEISWFLLLFQLFRFHFNFHLDFFVHVFIFVLIVVCEFEFIVVVL